LKLRGLLWFEARIVRRDALRLLVELDRRLVVLRVRQAAMPIQHLFAFCLVAIGSWPLYPLDERRIHITHRVVTTRRRHHQIPTHKRERTGKGCSLEQRLRYVIREMTWTLFRQWDPQNSGPLFDRRRHYVERVIS